MSLTTVLGYTPQFTIGKDGVDITDAFRDRVTTIKVVSVDGGGQGDKLDITLDDRGWIIAMPATEGDGAAVLQVSMGYAQNGLYDQGTFSINDVFCEGLPKSLRMEGTSNGFTTALKAPIIASYEGKTVEEILQSIAGSGGLSASVDPVIGSKVVAYLNQNSSPGHLLQNLERNFNGLAKFQDGKLSFTQRGTGLSATGQLTQSFAILPEDFGPSWSFKTSARPSHSKVRASYWDKVNHQLKWLESGVAPAGDSKVPYLVKQSYNTQDEAQAAADSMMGSLNRGIVTGSFSLAKGDPSIHGGSTFTVSNTRDGMDGSYTVKTATHTFVKSGGIQTTIEFYSESPSNGVLPRPKATCSRPPGPTPTLLFDFIVAQMQKNINMPVMFIRKAPKIVGDLMRDLGLTVFQACAILGNIGRECAGFMLMQEVHPVSGVGGYGWAQWTGPRRKTFFDFCKAKGLSVDSDEGNYAYLVHELQTTEAGAIRALRLQGSLASCTEAFEKNFERAGVPAIADRIHYAQMALAAYQASLPKKV